ncbi:hypothetical protein MARA_00630 (plasmid) [Mycolicibacterium arabiense]|uniref:Cytidyltransferase-like domain-containing protein n=1 Tax=Mycolicibacterium arabiense TaxID=1286181 RepID=A0A7I7RQ20_9MYCO|nr:hypothetical protein [Mycolicibacterium arabiense]MCV7372037.1 hypothetical protein [Mycolicibacterium arabiense]BBY46633.1 hypothetical protein MARA_00630 [Mycolicibacterium arabiense]
MEHEFRTEAFEDMKTNEWFGPAMEVYCLNDLRAAGYQRPLTGVVKASRDNPVTFFERENHPYVRFASSHYFDEIQWAALQDDPVIISAMGSYAPMHAGHVEMAEAADTALRAEGFTPIAAVFSPHSEQYVRAKILPTRRDALIATDARIAQAEDVLPPRLRSGTPTFIDTWDARMPGGPRSFTDIMIRLVRTLEAAQIRNVTPVAVFGPDNGISMRAFARAGQAVCVIRPGHEDEAKPYEAEPQMKAALRQKRVIVATREHNTIISSSEIRQRRAAG